LIFGAVIDDSLEDEVRITVIATGFDHTLPQMRPLNQRVESVRTVSQPVGQPVRDQSGYRPSNPSAGQSPRQSPSSQSGYQNYQRDNMDIPAFLRKKRD
jgi:cell division protein FtsZ